MMPLNRALDALAMSCCEIYPVQIRVEKALDRITAAPVRSPATIPSSPIALQDGWAVSAEETLSASPYAPVLASTAPRRVAFGDFLPDFADAVLPLSNVAAEPNSVEILSPTASGERVRARAGDFAEGETIVAAGKKLGALHIFLLKLAGIENVTVRIPRVRIFSQSGSGCWLASMARREGAESTTESSHALTSDRSVETLAQADSDLTIAIGVGGTRYSVERAIGMSGQMLFHGVAARPGEMICGGILHRKTGLDNAKAASSRKPDGGSCTERGTNCLPVLFIPDRMEFVLAAWLLLLRPWLRRLAGAASHDLEESLPLTRKITSMPGLSELALVRRVTNLGDKSMRWEPLATGDIPFSAIARADAWLLLEPGCEGYAAGQSVAAQFL
jgi:molybdopterin molybdotransferase